MHVARQTLFGRASGIGGRSNPQSFFRAIIIKILNNKRGLKNKNSPLAYRAPG
jgi:hypothetical protein